MNVLLLVCSGGKYSGQLRIFSPLPHIFGDTYKVYKDKFVPMLLIRDVGIFLIENF